MRLLPDGLVEALDDCFKLATNLPCDRHLIRDLLPTEDETVDQYVSLLRSQAKYCELADADDQIREQFLHVPWMGLSCQFGGGSYSV